MVSGVKCWTRRHLPGWPSNCTGMARKWNEEGKKGVDRREEGKRRKRGRKIVEEEKEGGIKEWKQ